MAKKAKPNMPNPSVEQVEHYLRAWDEMENYHLQEDALDKLFFTICSGNTDMSDILLKVEDIFGENMWKQSRHRKELTKVC